MSNADDREEEQREFDELTRSIHTKTLQKLLLVWYNVFHDYQRSPVAAKIIERAREKQPQLDLNLRNIAWALKPKDIAEMLQISKRHAAEYVKFFRIIYSETT